MTSTVTTSVIERASRGDEAAFRELTEPLRGELEFHCYRMLGSLHDAEDVLQETMLAAWRSLPGFEHRSSLRTWLYRIATNRCLNALRDASRRPPTPPNPPFPIPNPTRTADPHWLEPYPEDRLGWLADHAPGPVARYETREAVEITFIAALQLLSGRQRAVLVLRDVLGFHADETAQPLDGLAGHITARAEAHTIRLALIYTLLDAEHQIAAEHLHAALALWDYTSRSARWALGQATGDPLAEQLHAALIRAPDGLTRTQLSHHVHRNLPAEQLDRALQALAATGRARRTKINTGGRPAERWHATIPA